MFQHKSNVKMFLEICESGHLKLFKGIQLRVMMPPFLRLGSPPVEGRDSMKSTPYVPRSTMKG